MIICIVDKGEEFGGDRRGNPHLESMAHDHGHPRRGGRGRGHQPPPPWNGPREEQLDEDLPQRIRRMIATMEVKEIGNIRYGH